MIHLWYARELTDVNVLKFSGNTLPIIIFCSCWSDSEKIINILWQFFESFHFVAAKISGQFELKSRYDSKSYSDIDSCPKIHIKKIWIRNELTKTIFVKNTTISSMKEVWNLQWKLKYKSSCRRMTILWYLPQLALLWSNK